MLRLAVVLILLILVPSTARSEARIALLIGNQGYNAKVGPLKNPHSDIALIGAALKSLGFKVTEIRDADYRSIDAAIKRHAATVRREEQGTISLLYYSGHGAADPDTKTNYLIPVDVGDADDAELWNYSLNLNKIIEGLREQAPSATHYVVFDACRNELNLTRKGKKALSEKGFVPLAYTPGVMVAYSTAPGKTAADVGSSGGPYAKALAEEIVKPGVEAVTMFRRVALRVNREIGQDPWMSASTLPEVYFAGEQQIAKPEAPTRQGEAAEAWSATKDGTNITVLEAFVARYKDTFYAELARARIEELKKQQTVMNAPHAGTASLAVQPRHFRFAFDQPRSTSYGIGGDIFSERLKELSKGAMLIDQYPGAQLGQEPQMLQMVKAGEIDFCISGTASAAALSPQASVMSLHFLFRSEAHLIKALGDSNVNKAVNQMIDDTVQGAHVIGMATLGLRSMYSKREIRKVADMNGLKVRVLATATEDKMFAVYGAQTLHTPFGSVYTSLKTGVVDVAENGINVYLFNKHYEVAPVLSMTEHEANVSLVWISDKLWQNLTPEQRAWVQASADVVNKTQPGKALELERTSAEKLKSIGVKVITDVDKSGFIRLAAPYLEKLSKELGPHAAKVQQLISAVN